MTVPRAPLFGFSHGALRFLAAMRQAPRRWPGAANTRSVSEAAPDTPLADAGGEPAAPGASRRLSSCQACASVWARASSLLPLNIEPSWPDTAQPPTRQRQRRHAAMQP